MTPDRERARDLRDLAAVRMRADKVPFEMIASRLGLTRARVNQITIAIKTADLSESEEPRARVLQSYWGG